MNCYNYYNALGQDYHLNTNTRLIQTFKTHSWPKCEAKITWNGTNMIEHIVTYKKWPGEKDRIYTHDFVVRNLEQLLLFTNTAPSFTGMVMTSDNGMCDSPKIPIIEHSQSPLKNSILLPLHSNQVWFWAKNYSTKKEVMLNNSDCVWYGGRTGYAHIQSAFNMNRTRCSKFMTDRECVVNMHLPNIQFGSHLAYLENDCILAIDGNGYAGSLKTALYHQKLAIRVGGFSGGYRLSSYEWFEPFLQDNIHYIQSSIDALPETLERVAKMSMKAKQQIASNGHKAFMALINKTSISCYVRIAVQGKPLFRTFSA